MTATRLKGVAKRAAHRTRLRQLLLADNARQRPPVTLPRVSILATDDIADLPRRTKPNRDPEVSAV